MSGDLPPVPRPPVLVPTALPRQPSRRRSPDRQPFDALCPHGRVVEWLAVRVDAASRALCGCECEEAA